jgi:hypothetical protein
LNLPQQNALDLSYPTTFPSPPDRLETKHEPAWYFYLAEIALRRLKNRILSSLCRSDTAEMEREEIALDFEDQIDAWFVDIQLAKSEIPIVTGRCLKVSIPPRSFGF